MIIALQCIHVADFIEYKYKQEIRQNIRAPITNAIDIIDALGRILQKTPVAAYTTDIAVARLTNGIYLARIRFDNKQIQQKFIKN